MIMKKYVRLLLALLVLVSIAGCGGSEYRFNNQRSLPNLTGHYNFSATSQTMSQQYQGTAEVSQSNLAVQGSVTELFNYCAPSATVSGSLTPVDDFNPTSVVSYTVNLVLQENVVGGGTQEVDLTGTASANGDHWSGTYTAPPGSCTTGDSGVWSADRYSYP